MSGSGNNDAMSCTLAKKCHVRGIEIIPLFSRRISFFNSSPPINLGGN
jgi:hypothetical protein